MRPREFVGVRNLLGKEIEHRMGVETRVTILGYIQRGGSPSANDRVLATRFGVAAVQLIQNGEFGKMVALQGNHIKSIPLPTAVARKKTVTGAFLPGLSSGAITAGRSAPMLLIVLTYIALYQTAFQGLFTMLMYAIGLSIPLMVISSPGAGGVIGKQIKDKAGVSGEVFDDIIGVVIVLTGVYFICPTFP